MRYLLSEVEFYVPTLKEFEDHVVVIRKDQLEGSKLYVAPKDLVFASAQFGGNSKNTCDIPKFADIVLSVVNYDFGIALNYEIEEPSIITLTDAGITARLSFTSGVYLLMTSTMTEGLSKFATFIKENIGEICVAKFDLESEEVEEQPEEEDIPVGPAPVYEEHPLPVTEDEASSILEDSKDYTEPIPVEVEQSEELIAEPAPVEEKKEEIDSTFDDLGLSEDLFK